VCSKDARIEEQPAGWEKLRPAPGECRGSMAKHWRGRSKRPEQEQGIYLTCSHRVSCIARALFECSWEASCAVGLTCPVARNGAPLSNSGPWNASLGWEGIYIFHGGWHDCLDTNNRCSTR